MCREDSVILRAGCGVDAVESAGEGMVWPRCSVSDLGPQSHLMGILECSQGSPSVLARLPWEFWNLVP